MEPEAVEPDDLPPWMLEPEVELEPHQEAIVWNTTHRTLVLEGGVGIGKTFTGVVKMLELIRAQPGAHGLWIEPTSNLIGTILLARVHEWFAAWNIPGSYRTQYKGMHDVLIVYEGTEFETVVFLRSGDKPERITGFEVAWFIIDEADQCKIEVYKRCVERHRAPAKLRQRVVVHTPEPGFNWTWRVFHERRQPTMLVVDNIPTTANPNNPHTYVDDLKESHDEEELQRVLTGKRVGLTGRVYKAFSREQNGAPAPRFVGSNIYVGADFNVEKMVWVIGIETNDVMHIVGEIVGLDTTTDEQAQKLLIWLRDRHRQERPGYEWTLAEMARVTSIHVDPSARNRHHRAHGSDVTALRELGFHVWCNQGAIPIRDRVNTVNTRLKLRRLLVDTDAATELTSALERQGRDKNGDPEKNADPKADLSHAADALGYLLWGFPHWRATVPSGNQTVHPRGYV